MLVPFLWDLIIRLTIEIQNIITNYSLTKLKNSNPLFFKLMQIKFRDDVVCVLL
jgi:hypothetical protein